MRAGFVRLDQLDSFEDHSDAIEGIESDKQNYTGDWFSGDETPMKRGAVNKIAAIWKQIDKRWPE